MKKPTKMQTYWMQDFWPVSSTACVNPCFSLHILNSCSFTSSLLLRYCLSLINPCLQQHILHNEWSTEKVVSWSSSSHSLCLQSAVPLMEVTATSSIPEHLGPFPASSLPLCFWLPCQSLRGRLWGRNIKIYKDCLSTRTIQPSSPPVGTGFFVVKKVHFA